MTTKQTLDQLIIRAYTSWINDQNVDEQIDYKALAQQFAQEAEKIVVVAYEN